MKRGAADALEALAVRELNDEQRDAVGSLNGATLVLAGAGTGKTRVITWRIARLLAAGVEPDSILAVTFTNRAAAEMRERAHVLAGEGAKRVTLTTFHSFCARLLRRYGKGVGLTPSFTIYDDDDQLSLIRVVAAECGMPADAGAARGYRERIDKARHAALRVHDIETTARNYEAELFADLFARYDQALRTANAVDFGGLITFSAHLLEDDEDLRERLQLIWRYVLVDEFQDTDNAQYKLLRALVPLDGNIVAVGDDDQSIYGWRGASVENVRRFRDDYDARVVTLVRNYRSTRPILDVAHDIVSRVPDRMDKRVQSHRGGDEPVGAYIARDDREEADWVVRTIEADRRLSRRALSSYAIFYRANHQSRSFEERLRGAGLAYEVVGGVSFFERQEVRDLLAFLRVATNPSDDVAFRRIANVPARGIGDGTMDHLEVFKRTVGATGLALALPAFAQQPPPRTQTRTREGLARLADFVGRLRGHAGEGPAAVLRFVLGEVDYAEHLEATDPTTSRERMENVGQLVEAAIAFETEAPIEQRTVAGFVEYVSLRQPLDGVDEEAGAVRLMTVHASKGLEFDVVFVTGLEDGQFPMVRSGAAPTPADSAEERRLCYVAMTRAREKLFLTAAMRRRAFGQTRDQKPSPFLIEVPAQHVAIDPTSASQSLDWRRERAAPAASTTYVPRPGKARRPNFDEFDQRAPDEQESEIPAAGVVFDDSYFPTENQERAHRFIGHSARHALFGVGRVVEAEPSADRIILTIDFPGVGRKKAISSYVTLVD